MLRHVLRLTWNRRRANALVAVEVAAVFLVLFVLGSIYYRLWSNHQRPLGFVWQDVWEVSLSVPGDWSEEQSVKAFEAAAALATLPEVEAAHPINITPFRSWNWTSNLGTKDKRVRTWINHMAENAARDLGVELIDGRWFGPEDEGQPYRAALINRTFRDQVFGDSDPLGKTILEPDPEDFDDGEETYRVVGVIEDFRQRGEYFRPVPYTICHLRRGDASPRANFLYAKLAAGTPAIFEETVLETVQAIAPDWELSVHPWEHYRDRHHRSTLTPLLVMSTVASFLLLMVALGLIGVLWQEVVRRTQEIGLRRALGAPTHMIRVQISLELLCVASFGILLGAVLGLQLPMLDLVKEVSWQTAPAGLLVATTVILALVLLSSLYPSWVASRSTPSEALRYE